MTFTLPTPVSCHCYSPYKLHIRMCLWRYMAHTVLVWRKTHQSKTNKSVTALDERSFQFKSMLHFRILGNPALFITLVLFNERQRKKHPYVPMTRIRSSQEALATSRPFKHWTLVETLPLAKYICHNYR